MSMTTTFFIDLRSDLEANADIERKREEARMERDLAREVHFNYYN